MRCSFGVACFLGLFLSCARAQSNQTWDSGAYDPELVKHLHGRAQEYKAAAATQPSHPYAGEYYQGDGLGANITLSISPTDEFTYFWYGCLGLYSLNAGTVSADGNVLELHSDLKRLKDDTLPFASKFYLVRWGERTYLIASSETTKFVEYVNRGWEPREDMHGLTYLKVGNEKLLVKGDPELPEEFKASLAPLRTAHLTSIGEPRVPDAKYPDYVSYDCTIDLGSEQGVQVGHVFSASVDGVTLHFYVTTVSKTSSKVEISGKRDQITPKIGAAITGRIGKLQEFER